MIHSIDHIVLTTGDLDKCIAFYTRELAAQFHSYYNAERILVDDEALRVARLALCAAVRQVLANALSLLGVDAPEEM